MVRQRLDLSAITPNSIMTVIDEVDGSKKKTTLAIVPYCSKYCS